MKNILNSQKTSLSFEFFPPKTERGWDNLLNNIEKLMPLKPSSVSVTYGAGGSTRSETNRLVIRIHEECKVPVVPHQTCVAATRSEVRTIMQRYRDAGVKNVLALRGDPPVGEDDWHPPEDGFKYAVDLVRFIRAEFPDTSIGVAGFPEGHPQMPNRLLEIEYLKQKVDAGADYIVTQLFFDNRDFYDFCERCRLAGIEVPIIAGIMPLRNRKGMEKMAELAAGARFPAALLRQVAEAPDDAGVERVGLDWATEQVRDLLEHKVSGVHFYTLNSAEPTLEIFARLGLTAR
jgi:methylenetetrahydrofolate reductase (NADPH)